VPLPIILPSSVTSLGRFDVLFGWYADTILVRYSPEPTNIQDHRPSLVGSVPVSMIKLASSSSYRVDVAVVGFVLW
jgi:hypothetical protein